jgi:hypothetical protein
LWDLGRAQKKVGGQPNDPIGEIETREVLVPRSSARILDRATKTLPRPPIVSSFTA